MKLKTLIIALLTFTTIYAFTDDYTLPDVASEHIGTYIPVQMELQLKKTKLFYDALQSGNLEHHDVLFLGKNKCYSDAGFHDGYAIKAEDFKNYRFVNNDNGKYIIDQNGNSYHQISNKLNEKGYGYTEYDEYIINILFDFMKDMKNFSAKDGNEIVIDGNSYFIITDGWFLETENVAIWLRSEKYGRCALLKDGINAKIVKSQKENMMIYPKEDEVIKEIPLFFVDKNNYERTPTYGLSKSQLRYLRNYFYARQGYEFKDPVLREYFSNFTWYKVNPNFSENDFTNLQHNMIREIQEQEKR